MAKETVCVTGANGFIGSWIIRTLIEKGYTKIHASIYPGSDPTHLLKLPRSDGINTEIKIFEADLLDSDAISKAIDGCTGVFHVASPCTLDPPKNPEEELVEPAVKGTINVLEAAKRFNVRRVVITSSISALVPNPNWPEAIPVDESSWTDLDFCKSLQKWYPISKTLAEKAAWEFSEKHGTNIVTIHPSTCLGPLLQPNLNASCAVLQQLLQGSSETQEHHWLGVVHVRDVAKGHVMLFETPEASGRFLCTNGIYQFSEFAALVSKLFPECAVHKFGKETQPGLTSCNDAAKRLVELGLVFTAVEDAVKETVQSLRDKGFL
ncbi:Cinnamoyl-CoA reductase 1 [Cardamine amara subsp. amara]|uniref:Cinnamoyl-CoA reductase 1 n=1 Tax=Cardamine amara subsp. amara TaxID=228776 RepID=A0ABD1BV93_CARAN